MRTFLLVAAIGLVGCATATSTLPAPNPAEAGVAQLRIRFEGLLAGEGELVAALFDDPQSFESRGRPLRSAFLPVDDATVEWTLELPFGVYAVKAYQDLNGDRQLDRNALGMPSEPYGFSNDARGSFGPPSWGAARFEVDQPAAALEIDLR